MRPRSPVRTRAASSAHEHGSSHRRAAALPPDTPNDRPKERITTTSRPLPSLEPPTPRQMKPKATRPGKRRGGGAVRDLDRHTPHVGNGRANHPSLLPVSSRCPLQRPTTASSSDQREARRAPARRRGRPNGQDPPRDGHMRCHARPCPPATSSRVSRSRRARTLPARRPAPSEPVDRRSGRARPSRHPCQERASSHRRNLPCRCHASVSSPPVPAATPHTNATQCPSSVGERKKGPGAADAGGLCPLA